MAKNNLSKVKKEIQTKPGSQQKAKKQPVNTNQPKIKTIVLDNYKKGILNVFMFVLIMSIIVPFAIFFMLRNDGSLTLNKEDATNIYNKFMSSYAVNSYEAAKFSYSYTDSSDNKITQSFYFEEGKFVSRETITIDNLGSYSKVVVRKIKLEDRSLIETLKPEIAAYSAEQYTEYIQLTSECLVETYEKADEQDEYTLQNSIISASSLNSLGNTVSSIEAKIRNNLEISNGTTDIDFNIFGIDYTYLTTTLSDGENVLVFEGDRITKIILADSSEYIFSYTYTISE